MTTAGKRLRARLSGLVVTYTPFFDALLAGVEIDDSHASQDKLLSRLLQEYDLLAMLQARPSEYLRACHPTAGSHC